MWVLIGKGANNLQIPAMFWTDKEKALQQCEEIVGRPADRVTRENMFSWDLEENNENEEILGKIYTHYYSGCGACYQVNLKEIQEGTKFVVFDLD